MGDEEVARARGSNNLSVAKESRSGMHAALRSHAIRLEDAIDPNAERVDNVRQHDIIFGRGKGYQNHPGNQRMREIIDKYKIQYHSMRKLEKRRLVERVYKEITEDGAKFLKNVDGENAWVVVDAQVAMQKVSHTLRCRKRAEKLLMKEFESEATRGSASLLLPSTDTTCITIINAALNTNMPSGDRFVFPSQNLGRYGAQLEVERPLVMSDIVARSHSLDYAALMRREQFLQETMLLQQIRYNSSFLMETAGTVGRIMPFPTSAPLLGRSKHEPAPGSAGKDTHAPG